MMPPSAGGGDIFCGSGFGGDCGAGAADMLRDSASESGAAVESFLSAEDSGAAAAFGARSGAAAEVVGAERTVGDGASTLAVVTGGCDVVWPSW